MTAIRELRARFTAEARGLQRAFRDIQRNASDLARNNNILSSSFRNVNDRTNTAERTFRTASGQILTLNRNLNSTARTVRTSGNNIREMGRHYSAAETNVKRLRDAVRDTGGQLNNSQNRISGFRNAIGGLASSARDAARNIRDSFSNINQSLRETGDRLQILGGKMRDAGKSLTARVTLPIAAVGGAAVKTGMDFEEGMSIVAAISGATEKELQSLEDQARYLGATTKFSATEAAEGMQYLALAGFKTNDILSSMPGMLNLAIAGNMDLGRAADITSDVMTMFGLKAEQAGHAADVFAYAQANANTNVEQMGEALKYSGPATHSFGWSLEETSAATMAFANSGLKGSIAGQAFASSLMRLAKPTKRMGKLWEATNTEFFDMNGNFKSMPDIVKEVEKATKSMTQEQRASYLATTFGAEAYKHWAILLETGSDKLRKMTVDLENADGSAERMAKTMADNAKGDIKTFFSALQELGIQIYQLIQPAFRSFIQSLTDMVRWLQKLSPSLKLATVIFAGLVMAIGPVIAVFGIFIGLLGNAALGFLRLFPSIARAGGLLKWLRLGLTALTGPIGLIIGGITLLVSGFITAYKRSETFREILRELKDAFMSVYQSVKTFLTTNKYVLAFIDGVRKEFNRLVSFVGKIFELIFKIILQRIREIKQLFAVFTNFTKDIFQAWKAIFSGDFKKGLTLFKQAIADAFKGIADIIKSRLNFIDDLIGDKIRGWIRSVVNWFNEIRKGSKVFDSTLQAIGKIIKIYIEDFKRLFNIFKDYFINMLAGFKALFKGDFKEAFKIFKDGLIQFFKDIGSFIKERLILIGQGIAKTTKEWGSALVSWTKDPAKSLGNKLSELGTNIINWFKEMPGKIKQATIDWTKAAVSWLGTAVSEGKKQFDSWLQKVESWFKNGKKNITSALSGWKDAVINWFKDRANDIGDKLGGWKTTVDTKLGDIKKSFSNWLDSMPGEIKKKLLSWKSAFDEWLIKQYEENRKQYAEWGRQLSSWFTDTKKNLEKGFNGWWKTIKEMFSGGNKEWSIGLSGWWNTISGWLTDKKKDWNSKLDNWNEGIRGWFKKLPGISTKGLGDWWSNISKWLTDKKKNWNTSLDSWNDGIKGWFKKLPSLSDFSLKDWFKKIRESIIGWKDQLVKSFDAWWQGIKGWFGGLGKKPEIKKAGKEVVKSVVKGTKEEKKNWMDNIGKIIVDGIKYMLAAAVVIALAVGREIIKRIIKGITEMRKKFREILDNLLKILRDKTNDMARSVAKKMLEIRSDSLKKITDLRDGAISRFTNLRKRVSEIFSGIKKSISGYVSDMVDTVKNMPQRMSDGLRKMSGKIADGAKTVVNKLSETLEKGVNGVIDGINWILGKIGVNEKDQIPPKKFPRYAKGTDNHPGGPAWINDGKGNNAGQELIINPDGSTEMYKGRDVLANIQKGAQVLSAKNTRKFLETIPAYNSGKGWVNKAIDKGKDLFNRGKEKVKSGVKKVKDIALDVWDYASNPGKLLNKALEMFGVTTPDLAGAVGQIVKAGFKKVKSGAVDYIRDMFSISDTGFSGATTITNKWGIFDFVYDTAKKIMSSPLGRGLVITSGYRPGSKYDHGKRAAVDLAGFGRNGGYKKVAQWASRLPGVSYAIGDDTVFGRKYGDGSKPAWARGHMDHLHVSVDPKKAKSGDSSSNSRNTIKGWVRQAIAKTGVPMSWLDSLATIAEKESGGNPSAVNRWDSNAKRGTPSKGLMQMIDPTFNAHKMKGLNNIFNPVHNAVAAIRYIKSRYGTVFNTPGIRSIMKGGPYKGYADGGIVTTKQLAWIAEGGWAESIISHDPAKRVSQRAIWEQTGRELGFDRGDKETIDLLRRIADAVESGKDISINMDSREIGKLIEPHITRKQQRDNNRSRRFPR